jgi:hypothetical protein
MDEHQVQGTLFRFPSLPEDTDPGYLARTRAQREKLLAKAAKANGRIRQGERFGQNYPLRKLGNLVGPPNNAVTTVMPVPAGSVLTWTECGTEHEGVVWSHGHLPNSVWVTVTGEPRAVCLQRLWSGPTRWHRCGEYQYKTTPRPLALVTDA